MKIGALRRRIPTPLAFWALAGVALFVSHDAIFLVQVGPGEALVRTLREAGHGYWAVTSLALGAAGMAVAALTLFNLRRLRRRAGELGATAPGGIGRGFIGRWLRLFALVAIGFLVQENLEHYVSHMHAPGLGILLGPEYPLALPVIALISGLAAYLAAAAGGTARELRAAIAAALGRRFGHAPRSLRRPPARLTVIRISPLAAAVAGRAPPLAFAQHG